MVVKQPALGRLTHVEPRDVWEHEAHDFTPWLRSNKEVLEQALGIDVEIYEAEVPVGGYNVDLVGEDVSNGRRLIVENQLEETNHTHLGQVLTYAGGLDAATIVWISPHFRDEHRQALDWFNEHTDRSVGFFGLELEVIRIGDSLPAVNLKPAAVPNDWSKEVRQKSAKAEPSELAQGRHAFFEKALGALKAKQPGLTNATRVGYENWFTVPSGRTGPYFAWVFAGDGRFRTELYIDFGDHDANTDAFAKLQADREAIEADIGSALRWDPIEGRRAVRVYLDRDLVDPNSPASDPALLTWAVDRMIEFNRVFRPRVREL